MTDQPQHKPSSKAPEPKGSDPGKVPTPENVVPTTGQQTSVGAENTNTTKYTLSDVVEQSRARLTGHPDPYPDLPEEAMDAAKAAGLIPAGTGDSGKALRPDEAPGEIRSLGRYGATAMLTPSEALQGKGEGVEMVFPKPVHLTTDDRQMIDYPAGIHRVPAGLVSHSYLKASGAYPKPEAEKREPESIPEGRERLAQRAKP